MAVAAGVAVAAAGGMWAAGTADAAPLTSVSKVTVAVGSPSPSANALTTYVVGFKTSSSGTLSGNAGATITVTLPAGTGLAKLIGSTVYAGTTDVGECFATTATVVTCSIYGGDTIKAGATATVALNGVTNPATAKAYTLTVSTSADKTPVTSPPYTITAATAVTAASVAVSKNLTSASGVTYTVKFKVSTGLAGDSGSTIPVTLPAGTGLTKLNQSSSTVFDGTTNVGECSASTATMVVCSIYGGDTVKAGDSLVVTLSGVKNPAKTKAYALKLSTSSDTKTVSPSYCIAAAGVPCIAGLSPASGKVGAAVTITGINLSGATAIAFNGTAATVITDTATKITTKVPAGATTGPVTVKTKGGTATSSTFTVIPSSAITG